MPRACGEVISFALSCGMKAGKLEALAAHATFVGLTLHVTSLGQVSQFSVSTLTAQD